jgi:hypothetical protein
LHRFRTIAVTAVAGIALVACGSGASSDSGAPGGGSQAAASQAAASQAEASEDAFRPSFSEGLVADLEALIPDTVGELDMTKSSMRGNEFLISDTSDPATVQFLEDIGVAPNDVSMAVGFGFSADAATSLIMFVFRAEGAATNQLISAFKASLDSQRDTPLTWTSGEIGGTLVEKALDGETAIYLYAKDDILIFVSGDADSAAEAISELP